MRMKALKGFPSKAKGNALAALRKVPPHTYSLRYLFKNSVPGLWYDLRDLSTLYQDSTGTTPVTGVEQPLGLTLDKSQGLVLGPELIPSLSGSGDSTAGWLTGSASIASVSGEFEVTTIINNHTVRYNLTVVPGRTYKYSWESRLGTMTGLKFSVYDFTGVANIIPATTYTPGVNTAIFTAPAGCVSAAVYLVRDSGNTGTAYFDNISVRELPGIHASQATSTARPKLSSRYNMLTHTEDFSNAAWNKSAVTITSNAAVAPDGTMTADKIVCTVGSAFHFCRMGHDDRLSKRLGFFAKKSTAHAFVALRGSVGTNHRFNLNTGVLEYSNIAPTASGSEYLGDGWWYLWIEETQTASGFFGVYPCLSTDSSENFTATGDEECYILGASLVPANQSHLPYQRVGDSPFALASRTNDYDWDFSKFPPYAAFDGIDDFLVTPSVDFTGTDEMFVCAGARKLMGGGSKIICELSASLDVEGNTGAFWLGVERSGGSYNYASRGTLPDFGSLATATGFSVPHSGVISGISSIPMDASAIRVNGVLLGSSSTNQGTGSFGNYPLYIGMRAGSSLPFNGNLHQLVIVGRLPSDHELAATERYVANKSGITL